MKHEAQELLKSLDAGENALLNDMVRSVSSAIKSAPDEGEASRLAEAFLRFVSTCLPEALEGTDVQFDDDEELEKDAGWESVLKNTMADHGAYYFGPIQKHLYGIMGKGPGAMDIRGYGPRGKKNPNKSKTHSNAPAQAIHGRGGGTRTGHEEVAGLKRMFDIMDGVGEGEEAQRHYDALSPERKKALQEIKQHLESHNITLPTREEMQSMSHEEQVKLLDAIGIFGESRGGTLNVVDTTSTDDKGSFKRRARDIADYAPKAERGAGENLKQSDNSGTISALDTWMKNKRRRTDGTLDGHVTDADRRVGALSRHDKDTHAAPRPGQKHRVAATEQANAEAAGVPVGNRGYGAEDPEGTAADQPKMTENKYKAQKINQNQKQKEKLEQTPRPKLKDLIADLNKLPAGKTADIIEVDEKDLTRAGGQTTAAEPAAVANDQVDSGSVWGSPATVRAAAKRIAAEFQGRDAASGGTYSADNLEAAAHTSGYYVSEQQHQKIVSSVSASNIEEYLRQNEGPLRGKNFGVWQSRGKTYLDVTRHFETKEEADAFAQEHDQAAVWDIGSGKEVPVTAVVSEEGRRLGEGVANKLAVAMADFAKHEAEAEIVAMAGRDRQQGRLYAAEGDLIYAGFGKKTPVNTPLTTSSMSEEERVAALQAEVDRITGSDWWKQHFPNHTKITATLRPGDKEGADARRATGELRFGPTTRSQTPGIVLHELIHTVTSSHVEGHGPEYAKNHLEATRHFWGEEAAKRLEDAYRAHRVEVFDGPVQGHVPDKAGRKKARTLGVELYAAKTRANWYAPNDREGKPNPRYDPAKYEKWRKKVDQLSDEMASIKGKEPSSSRAAEKPNPDAIGSKEDKMSLLSEVAAGGLALRAKKARLKADGKDIPADLERSIYRNNKRRLRLEEILRDQHRVSREELKQANKQVEAGTGKLALKESLRAIYQDMSSEVASGVKEALESGEPFDPATFAPKLDELRKEKNRVISLLKNKHGMTDRDIRNIREGALGKPERKPRPAKVEQTPVEAEVTAEATTEEPVVQQEPVADKTTRKRLTTKQRAARLELNEEFNKIKYGKAKPSKSEVARVTAANKNTDAKDRKLKEIEDTHRKIQQIDPAARKKASDQMLAAAQGKPPYPSKRGPGFIEDVVNSDYMTRDQRIDMLTEAIGEGWEELGVDVTGLQSLLGIDEPTAAAMLADGTTSTDSGIEPDKAAQYAEEIFDRQYYGVSPIATKDQEKWTQDVLDHYLTDVANGGGITAYGGTSEEKAALQRLFPTEGLSAEDSEQAVRETLARMGYTDEDIAQYREDKRVDPDPADEDGTFGGPDAATYADDDFGIPDPEAPRQGSAPTSRVKEIAAQASTNKVDVPKKSAASDIASTRKKLAEISARNNGKGRK